MVKQEIDFLFDFGSPNAFLVHKVLPDLAARTGARLVHVPILLGGIFKSTNNQSPVETFAGVKGKMTYLSVENTRFVRRHGLAFHWNPHFPIGSVYKLYAFTVCCF